jgi:hypothetical protein
MRLTAAVRPAARAAARWSGPAQALAALSLLLLAVAVVSLLAGRWEAGLVAAGFASPLAVGAFLLEVLRPGGWGDQEAVTGQRRGEGG